MAQRILNGTTFAIRLRRDPTALLNTTSRQNKALEGEPHYTTDTKQLYIWTGTEMKRFVGESEAIPTSTADTVGNIGDMSYDDDSLYVKTNVGWKKGTISGDFNFIAEDLNNKENIVLDNSAIKYPTVNLLKTSIESASLTVSNKKLDTSNALVDSVDDTKRIEFDVTEVIGTNTVSFPNHSGQFSVLVKVKRITKPSEWGTPVGGYVKLNYDTKYIVDYADDVLLPFGFRCDAPPTGNSAVIIEGVLAGRSTLICVIPGVNLFDGFQRVSLLIDGVGLYNAGGGDIFNLDGDFPNSLAVGATPILIIRFSTPFNSVSVGTIKNYFAVQRDRDTTTLCLDGWTFDGVINAGSFSSSLCLNNQGSFEYTKFAPTCAILNRLDIRTQNIDLLSNQKGYVFNNALSFGGATGTINLETLAFTAQGTNIVGLEYGSTCVLGNGGLTHNNLSFRDFGAINTTALIDDSCTIFSGGLTYSQANISVNAGSKAIDVSPLSILSPSAINLYTSIGTGGGILFDGIDIQGNEVNSANNVSIEGTGFENSKFFGSFSWYSGATTGDDLVGNTVNSGAGNTLRKALGTTYPIDIFKFLHTDNRLTYTGSFEIEVFVEFTGLVSINNSAGNPEITIAITKNGDVQTSLSTLRITSKATADSAGRDYHVGCSGLIILNTNDYIEIFIKANNKIPTLSGGNLSITKES